LKGSRLFEFVNEPPIRKVYYIHKLLNKFATGRTSKLAPTKKPKLQPVKTPPKAAKINRMKFANVTLIPKHQKIIKFNMRG
jgi:hypothetical protein